jgi:probable HAF family extracellular repeat protein
VASRSRVGIGLLSALLGAAAGAGAADPPCHVFEVPGSVPGTTQAFGINDLGQIVGAYTDQPGDEGSRHQHAFLFSDGQFSSFDVEDSQLTVAYGINNAGDIVGSYARNGDHQPTHGFLRRGGFSTIHVDGAFFTDSFGINNGGAVVGQFGGDSVVDPEPYRGYRLQGGSFTFIDFPDSQGQTVPWDINDAGTAVGWAPDRSGYHMFLWTDGQLTAFDYPDAYATLGYGINNAGKVVGFYSRADLSQGGFVRSPAGQFKPFDCEGTTGTQLYDISNNGAMVGTYPIAGGPYVASFYTDPVIEVLPETTRLKPQRGDQPIEVVFSGPPDLESATLEVKDPDGTDVTVDPPPVLEQTTAPYKYRLVWTGPWTRNNPDTGQSERLPAGNYSVVVKGTRAGNGAELESEPYDKVSLVEVKKIELAQCGSIAGVTCQDGGAVLAENRGSGGTAMPGDGKAAFPDAPQPGGDFQRTVLVKAELEPDLGPDAAKATVYFRFVDVDDPSASTAPVDDDGAATTSTDNRNETATITASVAASPDYDGAAVGYFRVSTQQGNNYRLAASTHEPWLGGITGVVSSQTGEVSHASGETLTTGVQVSEMLTVWRTLHLELTAFDPAPRTQLDLQYNGIWSDLGRRRLDDATSPFFTITVDGLLDHTTRNGWRGADLNPYPAAGQDFLVGGNSVRRLSTRAGSLCNAVPAGFCQTSPPGPADRAYFLRDDKLSSLSVPQDLSILRTILDGVYIFVEALPGPPLGWMRNLRQADQMQIQGTLPNSPAHWSAVFALGFDPETEEDYDPTDDGRNRPDPPVVGRWAPVPQEPVAVAFLEAIRDYIDTASKACIRPTVAFGEFYRGTTAHEVLHTLFLVHDGDTTGGIMCSAIKIFASQPNRNAITAKQKATLRDLLVPGVFRDVPDAPGCAQIVCP